MAIILNGSHTLNTYSSLKVVLDSNHWKVLSREGTHPIYSSKLPDKDKAVHRKAVRNVLIGTLPVHKAHTAAMVTEFRGDL